jgi:prepilin-type processing-associated H-X9-DG protein
MSTVRSVVISSFFCPSDPNSNVLLRDRTTPLAPCLGGAMTRDNTAQNRQFGMMCNYSGSYGDGYNNKPGNPYDTAGANLQYGCGGCNASGSAAETPSADCPSPTGPYGSGPNHRGLFDYQSRSGAVTLGSITDGTSNTFALGEVASVVRSQSAVWYTNTGRGFSSFHSGGCNFGMADGSIRFVKQTVNLKTYNALGSRKGGEVISADAY